MTIRSLLFLCAAVVSLSACGGGGGDSAVSPSVDANTTPLAPGSYKLAFSAISTSRLNTSISGIDVAVKFPAGISVSTVTGNTGQIVATSVTPGTVLQATSLVFGSYSASTRTAYLSMVTSQETYRSGQFLNLLFTVESGSSVTPNDIFALNSSYPKYKVVGFDTATHSTVVMTGKVKTMLGVAP